MACRLCICLSFAFVPPFITISALHLCRFTFVSEHLLSACLTFVCVSLLNASVSPIELSNLSLVSPLHLSYIAPGTVGSVKSLFMTNICTYNLPIYTNRLFLSELRWRRTQPPVVKPKAVTAPLWLWGQIQNGAVAKSYMTIGLLIYGEIFAHFLIGSPSSYMTLQLLQSEFPYIWGKFHFLFYQCRRRRRTSGPVAGAPSPSPAPFSLPPLYLLYMYLSVRAPTGAKIEAGRVEKTATGGAGTL
jgi:hypothetical protein